MTEETAGGLIVSEAGALDPLSDAVIVAVVVALTGDVVTGVFPVVCPPATVTIEVTAAAALFEEIATFTPAAGAGCSDSAVTVGGKRFIVVERATPSRVAVMVTAVCTATDDVWNVTVALRCPAATTTEEGTTTAGLEELRAIVAPEEGAGAVTVTVSVEVAPAMRSV